MMHIGHQPLSSYVALWPLLIISFISLSSSALAFSASPSSPSIASSHQHQLINNILHKMVRFFGQDMIDTTNRFYYACYPAEGVCEHYHMPIRDIASAWDATKAYTFVSSSTICKENDDEVIERMVAVQQQLESAIKCTLSAYQSNLQPNNVAIDGGSRGLYLHEDTLLETPTIGHSALLLLGVIGLSILEQDDKVIQDAVNGLVVGILSQQSDANGAFYTEFGSNDYLRGIEFYPGEAILSLLHAHELTTATLQQSILQSIDKAYTFYSNYYYTSDTNVNYNIWQILAFAKYYDVLISSNNIIQPTRIEEVKKYVLDMCQEICTSKSWKYQLYRGKPFYPNISTVEIACGLDALAEGIRLTQSAGNDDDTTNLCDMFQMHAKNAVYFLEWSQDQVADDCVVGKGGLGYGGIQVLEQRLDVTGHAISALMKLREVL